jgi:hypothetical protein
MGRLSVSSPPRPRPFEIASPLSQATDGALLERLMRLRAACQALATELAGTRRKLRSVEAELYELKRRHGES